MNPLLTDEEIRELVGDRADRVIITSEATHKEIGIKVKLFTQAISITWKMTRSQQERAIKNLLFDLRMMNERDAFQHRQAAKAAKRL